MSVGDAAYTYASKVSLYLRMTIWQPLSNLPVTFGEGEQCSVPGLLIMKELSFAVTKISSSHSLQRPCCEDLLMGVYLRRNTEATEWHFEFISERWDTLCSAGKTRRQHFSIFFFCLLSWCLHEFLKGFPLTYSAILILPLFENKIWTEWCMKMHKQTWIKLWLGNQRSRRAKLTDCQRKKTS